MIDFCGEDGSDVEVEMEPGMMASYQTMMAARLQAEAEAKEQAEAATDLVVHLEVKPRRNWRLFIRRSPRIAARAPKKRGRPQPSLHQ